MGGWEKQKFFQDQIEEEYGSHRVCTMSLTFIQKFIALHKTMCGYTTYIFLFNIQKDAEMDQGKFLLLEDIKDGKATTLKYTTQ